MKRVRYLAGAAALAPAAAGMVLPAASASASPSVKTVSLAHSGMRPAGDVTVTACTANTAFTIGQVGNVNGHGWYKNMSGGVCIGTVDVSLKFNKTFSKNAFLNVYSKFGARLYRKAHRFEGTAGTTVVTAFTVRALYAGNYVSVCASSTYDQPWLSGSPNPGICVEVH